MVSLVIKTLQKEDDKNHFDCGNDELNIFFKKYASQNQFKHYIGTTYIAIIDNTIVGFVTISASSIKIDDYENMDQKLPKYPLPILRISRLAVDKNFQNKSIGKELLKFVLNLSLQQKEQFGCIGVVVDAKDEAVDFYTQFGFKIIDITSGELDIRPFAKTMFLSTKTILNAL
jgi:ribosomal protein S18 acetylase RimI-like enzyme